MRSVFIWKVVGMGPAAGRGARMAVV